MYNNESMQLKKTEKKQFDAQFDAHVGPVRTLPTPVGETNLL
jgi:hypothetical protein